MTQRYAPISKKRDTFPNSQSCFALEWRASVVRSSHLKLKMAQGNNNNPGRPHVVGRKGTLC